MKKTICLFLILFSFARLAVANTNLYSVEIRNAPLADIIRMLAELDGKSVVVPTGISGTVTASFKESDLKDVLKAVLESNALGMIEKGDIVRVATSDTMEKLGEDLVTRTISLKYAKAEAISNQVKSLLSTRGSVMVDVRTNTVTVRDVPAFLDDAEVLIANVDRRDRQVFIDARILEASVEFIRSLGIQWGANGTTGEVAVSGLTAVGTAPSGRGLILATPASGLNSATALSGVGLVFGGSSADMQITAAEDRGDINILSRPSIVTMNNQPASIHSGVSFRVKTAGNVTIGSGSTGASTTASNLEEIQAGITLSVTPQITEDGRVHLTVDVTESQPDFSRQVDGIPAIIENTATTTVFLKDGEVTVIGGLYQTKDTKSQKGIPGLHR
ncbi:MAG: secretin N-terminal domain-containing protein, partial [Deltaproteobacteria bacterium]|nr:secretin N-terminal domain-containing protein [Deltaproteobacteria bacterium]